MDPFNHYAIALEYASMNNVAAAIAKLEELLKISPSYVPAYQQLGSLLRQAGDAARAGVILSRGIALASSTGEQHARNEMQDLLDEINGEL
jgi:tetratricopeptide (TPR) repeat protein